MRHASIGSNLEATSRCFRGVAATFGLGVIIIVSSILHATAASPRLFIQIWWDSPSIEMDPSEDPGRLEIYVGDNFVGCAVAPSHINYRKQLMLVPPSVGFTAEGAISEVEVKLTGELVKLPGRNIKITEITDNISNNRYSSSKNE